MLRRYLPQRLYFAIFAHLRTMKEEKRIYIAIDLKSFYASAECVDRGLDPLTTNLVVADVSRTEKTICLAVSPSLKAQGISGRARLFEVVQRVKDINFERAQQCGWHFTGKSFSAPDLDAHPDWELSYIAAPPRMQRYIEVSSNVFATYLKYVSPEDIHAYSIDEVFMDVTNYLSTYNMSAHELAMTMIRDVLRTTGITATAGIGTNMYLAKIAMDIVAKHIPADKDGVRIAELDEQSYRRTLWDHHPLTDFWRVGRGMAARLYAYGLDTMGKIARQSVENDELLYHLFGVNAELLIDHAWGWEPCTIKEIKAYKPESSSYSNGQVLQEPYTWQKARVVVKEMADASALNLLEKHKLTDQIVLDIGYDHESLTREDIRERYHGPITTDRYGRTVPKRAHGSEHTSKPTDSVRLITEAALRIFDRIANPLLLIRYLNISTCHVVDREETERKQEPVQLDLFTDYEADKARRDAEQEALRKEHRLQEARLAIKERFGKNAILRGLNFEEGATARERNKEIGGHKA